MRKKEHSNFRPEQNLLKGIQRKPPSSQPEQLKKKIQAPSKSGLSLKVAIALHIVHQVPVVQKVDNSIHRINRYPVDSVVCFVTLIRWIAIYPADIELSTFRITGARW